MASSATSLPISWPLPPPYFGLESSLMTYGKNSKPQTCGRQNENIVNIAVETLAGGSLYHFYYLAVVKLSQHLVQRPYYGDQTLLLTRISPGEASSAHHSRRHQYVTCCTEGGFIRGHKENGYCRHQGCGQRSLARSPKGSQKRHCE
jgi:hypothetical protein